VTAAMTIASYDVMPADVRGSSFDVRRSGSTFVVRGSWFVGSQRFRFSRPDSQFGGFQHQKHF